MSTSSNRICISVLPTCGYSLLFYNHLATRTFFISTAVMPDHRIYPTITRTSLSCRLWLFYTLKLFADFSRFTPIADEWPPYSRTNSLDHLSPEMLIHIGQAYKRVRRSLSTPGQRQVRPPRCSESGYEWRHRRLGKYAAYGLYWVQ